ncbi:MAG TPA: hypothetical protein VGJ18_03195 [Gemmatimonadaceae bacterium]|jgi:hypothetical protein
MSSRLAVLKEDIARRIRPVMPDLPEAEFDSLVERMALLQMKYEQIRLQSFQGIPGRDGDVT